MTHLDIGADTSIRSSATVQPARLGPDALRFVKISTIGTHSGDYFSSLGNLCT